MSKGNPIQPVVVATLLCDTIITEAETGKKSLIGVFDRVMAGAFPAGQRFGIYVRLTDAEGPYGMRLDYVDLSADRVLERLEFGPLVAPDRLRPSEVVLSITAPIPTAGAYEFRLYADGSWLARLPFETEVRAVEGEQTP